MRFQSFAKWNPEEVPTGALDHHNETTDDHGTEAEAQGVADMLMRDGFGGERRVFPVETGVRPVPTKAERSALVMRALLSHGSF